MAKGVYFPDLYIEKNNSVLNRLKEINKFRVEITRNEMVNLKTLNLSENKLWDFLEGARLRGKSGNNLIFKKKTTPQIAQLLGFIITDGSLLSTEGRVKLCQIDINLILDYINIINSEYKTNVTFGYNGAEASVMSIPLRYILHKYYNIPLGKKVFTVEVPKQVFYSQDKEVLKAFISGLFDGDGYISYRYLEKGCFLDYAKFCISTSSHILVKQAIQILDRLGIKCSSLIRRDDNRMTLETAGFENSLSFYQQIVPFLFHRERKERANKIFISHEFINKLTLSLNDDLRKLFGELRKSKLDRELLNFKLSHNYVRSLRSIESWTYPSKNVKVRSIYIYRTCQLLNKNPKEYIPQNQLEFMEKVLK